MTGVAVDFQPGELPGPYHTAREARRATSMNSYAIWNMNVGECLGVFNGTTEDEVIDAMARDAGFRDYDEMVDTYGMSREEARSELDIRIVR